MCFQIRTYFTWTGRYKDNNQSNSWQLLHKSCAKQHYASQLLDQKIKCPSKEGPRANIMCKWHKAHLRRSSKHTDMPWPKIYTAAMTLLYFTLFITGCSKNKPQKIIKLYKCQWFPLLLKRLSLRCMCRVLQFYVLQKYVKPVLFLSS